MSKSSWWLAGLALFLLIAPAQAQDLKPGAKFRDCRDVCPYLTVIPAGKALLGSTAEETMREHVEGEKWINRDKPQYTVTIAKPFAIGTYEITVAQWRAFVRATGHKDGASCWIYNVANAEQKYKFEEVVGVTWHDLKLPGIAQRKSDPISCVSYDDVQAYLAWISQRTGKAYRLPSEGEWEYAARAGSTTSRFWGDDRDRACIYGNLGDMTAAKRFAWRDDPQYHFSCTDGYAAHAPVGSFKPNAFGLYDTQGNVYEWVADCFAETNEGAPTDGSARVLQDCSQRSLRGGGFGYYPHYERTAFRIGTKPDYHSFLLGFRVLREL
jgi:formylglycine-generating enzyme required for sulfatase activity